MGWEEHIQAFQGHLRIERGLSDHSVEAYLRDVNKLKSFVENRANPRSPLQVEQHDLVDFLEWITLLGLAEHSQARILSGIKSFFNYLVYEDLLEQSPAQLLESPSLGRKFPEVLSLEEIETLLRSMEQDTKLNIRNRAIIETLYSCGLRVSELTGLRLSGIHWESGIIQVIGKRNKERLVPIGKWALKSIRTYLQKVREHQLVLGGGENLVFLNRSGRGLSRVMVFKIVQNCAERSGIPKKVSPHTFRHTFATHLVDRGADLRAVQDMLGHESILTTEIYTHLSQKFLRDTIREFHPRG